VAIRADRSFQIPHNLTAGGGEYSERHSDTCTPSENRPLLVPIEPTDPLYAKTKRATDVALSSLALVVLTPIFLVVALAILVTSGRPIIYRQTRLGLGGQPFTLYKFRSMVPDADRNPSMLLHLQGRNGQNGPIYKPEPNSAAVTPIGRYLRKSSIDETPQLFNVLRGEMSLVGPRPPLPEEVATYTPHELRRLSVIPGLTCIWQVSGRSNIPFDRWVDLDLEYIHSRSTLRDWTLILRTIPAVVTGRGAR
jgi:lipopolysaccharide/colanic/teichoic acid biosynthesis glycosyltransferase